MTFSIICLNRIFFPVNIDRVEVKLITQDVGKVTAYTAFTITSENKEVAGKNCYQDVYLKRKGRWQAISTHVTLLGIK
ncbi:MAG: hypothetical protein ABUT20_43940 [Bacteroidota bacterium]